MKRARMLCVGAIIITMSIPLFEMTVMAQAPKVQKKGYKKSNRNQVAIIARGNVEEAIAWYKKELDGHTGDQEALYGLVLAYTRKEDLGEALKYVKKAVEAGLPFGRFYAGPRNLLEPLYRSPAFKEYAKWHPVELIHGPMLGAVTSRSARFKVRTAFELPVSVRLSAFQKMENSIESAQVKTSKDDDYTATVEISGLEPSTRYFYDMLLGGKVVELDHRPSFKTYPPEGASGKFQIGFGGGAGYTPWNERMWDTIRRREPSAFLQMGDNVYIDHPEIPEVQQYCYYRRLSHPMYRRFAANTAIYAIWDDHDFAFNDHPGGGADPNLPAWKRSVLRIFKENFVNPYYGGQTWPGVWHDLSIGDVDFFLLDGRYYRTDATKPNPSMLGPVQKRWLLDKLKASKATFKVIASPVPWAFSTKGGTSKRDDGTVIKRGIDTWEGFPEEREEIFSFIEKNHIEGVFLISADRHRSDLWKIERENGYTLYDAMSSKVTNNKSHGLMDGAVFGYNAKCSYGLLTFDTDRVDPELTYEIVNIENDVVHQLVLKKSQLTFIDDCATNGP